MQGFFVHVWTNTGSRIEPMSTKYQLDKTIGTFCENPPGSREDALPL